MLFRSLFIYTLAKAINKGYIGNEYIEPTQKAFDGMVKTFTRLEEDGSYTITNCCAVAGLGGDSKRYRDGSFEYYISEPIIENDPKSVGSFILAKTENSNSRLCGEWGMGRYIRSAGRCFDDGTIYER